MMNAYHGGYLRPLQTQTDVFSISPASHLSLINTLKEGVVVIDEQHRICLKNKVAQSFSSDFTVMEGALVQIGDLDVSSIFDEILTGKRNVYETTVETVQKFQCLQVTFSPFWKDGRIWGVVMAIRDISRERELEAQLVQSEKLSKIGQLFAQLSHQLTNPLTAISGYSQLLLSMTENPQLKNSASRIYHASSQIQEMVQNLLGYIRKNKPIRTRASINDIIRSTVETMQEKFHRYGVLVKTVLDPGVSDVMVDIHEIAQALINLMDNACHALSNGGGCIEISSEQRADRIHVSISDNGPGIPAHYIDKIFEPFFTTKSLGEGTGLGLSITRNIVYNHNGSLHVESSLGKGSTFTVILPIIEQKPMPVSSLSQHALSGKQVLIVDDEPKTSEFLKRYLEIYAYEVDIATDGEIALKRISQQPYDLIISDIYMPGCNGFSFYQRLCELNPDFQSRILFVTADYVQPEVQAFLKETSLPCLTKPFSLDELKMALGKVLDEV